MTKKFHNPKSHTPAVYIPCWLIQVPIKLLSHGAKMTYGRLSHWSNETGRAFRSAKQLAEELGTSSASIEKYLKELRDVKLIQTYHPQAGGQNHFRFYDHPWMHEKIKEQLMYKSDKENPPPDLTVPSPGSYGTLPPDLTDININKIKKNNIYNKNKRDKDSPASQAEYKETYYPESKASTKNLTIQTIHSFNPHELPKQMIDDWIENRRAKKAAITLTAWEKINKELSKCKNPIAAFEEFVASGWSGFKKEWVEKDDPKKSHFNNDSTSWAVGIEQDIF